VSCCSTSRGPTSPSQTKRARRSTPGWSAEARASRRGAQGVGYSAGA
jgi:hypothetical protein